MSVSTEHYDCESCGAGLVVSDVQRSLVCPYCASPSVIHREPEQDRPSPDFVIPFVIEDKTASEKVKAFLRSKYFAPSSLKEAKLDNIRGIYLPSYLYTACADSEYRAEIGEEYLDEEKYQARDQNGKFVTKTRTVVRTEWYTLKGKHSMYLKDIVVSASAGLPNHELEAVEPFDLRFIRRYAPAIISGWIAEEASLSKAESKSSAHEESMAEIGTTLNRFLPGDKHRDLSYSTELRSETVALCLLPLWVFAVRYHPKKPPLRLIVNGQTGEAGGHVPTSWFKVLMFSSVLIGIGLLVYLWSTQ